jgi:Rrf2 family protein
MPTSSRFTVAVHILSGLAIYQDEPLTSQTIAASVHTNPAVIRRLLSMLGQAGLTYSRLGHGGGSLIARAPETITLLDVYRAVENQSLFAMHRTAPDKDCVIGRHIKVSLQPALGRAVSAFQVELSKITIADIVEDIRSRNSAEADLKRIRSKPNTVG